MRGLIAIGQLSFWRSSGTRLWHDPDRLRSTATGGKALMGTARTSPKVVRERRAHGIRSNRGKVRRHFPKARRSDRRLETVARVGKAWTPASDQLEAAVERLVAVASVPEALRDDLTQELWVKVLEGTAETQIRDDLDLLVADVKRDVWGIAMISLDSMVGDRLDSPRPLSDFVDEHGHMPALVRRNSRHHLRFNRMDRTGIPHTAETKRLMSKRRKRLWAGEYGAQRRAALNVTHKVCRHCGFAGSWDQFTKNPKCFGGVDKICKSCNRSKKNEWKQRQRATPVSVSYA